MASSWSGDRVKLLKMHIITLKMTMNGSESVRCENKPNFGAAPVEKAKKERIYAVIIFQVRRDECFIFCPRYIPVAPSGPV